MKNLKFVFAFLAFVLFVGVPAASACDIEIKVVSDKKENFEVGDEIILLVKVAFTHRVCPESIKNTKFDAKGIKILSGTDWKETSPGKWERKLKVSVLESKKGKLALSVTRTCEKDGGFGSIKLQANK